MPSLEKLYNENPTYDIFRKGNVTYIKFNNKYFIVKDGLDIAIETDSQWRVI